MPSSDISNGGGWDLFGRTCQFFSTSIDLTDDSDSLTSEEFAGCFTYFVDEFEETQIQNIIINDGPDFKFEQVYDIIFEQLCGSNTCVLPVNNYYGNCYIEPCGDGISNACLSLTTTGGEERTVIVVEHCCQCDPDSMYGPEGNYFGFDRDSYNCEGKLQTYRFATSEQIEEIQNEGGYFSSEAQLTQDGVSYGSDFSGLWRLVEVTNISTFFIDSPLHFNILTTGENCDDTLSKLPLGDTGQEAPWFGGECIYEYFQGCNSGNFYHIWSDIWNERGRGLDRRPNLNENGEVIQQFNDFDFNGNNFGWTIQNNYALVNGWLGSGDRKPTTYKLSIPACAYNNVDGFDKLPRPNGNDYGYCDNLWEYYTNYEGTGAEVHFMNIILDLLMVHQMGFLLECC